MFACLYTPDEFAGPKLAELAGSFSPFVEMTAPGTVIFSIAGLGRLFGTPHQIAAEIARRGAERGIVASLAIASNPDTAAVAARNLSGVTVIPPGEEAARLEDIPLERLAMPLELLETFDRWGMKTLGDVAALPPIGLAERLGEEGVRLHELSLGRAHRPLRLAPPPTSYTEREELEDPVSQVEPLLFVLTRMLGEICGRLEAQSLATNRITLRLRLENRQEHTRILELPVPQRDTRTFLKLLELDLEAHPPPAAVTAAELTLDPAEPRTLQRGLFLPLAPEPAKLQLTLARITAMVGEGNAGTPELLNTHRPDAFHLKKPGTVHSFPDFAELKSGNECTVPGFVVRVFRPVLPASVRLRAETPHYVAAPGVRGEVSEAAGPWRTSGEWWTRTRWARDEWDVELERNGLYRIYFDLDVREWFVEGVYD